MNNIIQTKPTKKPSQTANSDRHPDKPYTLVINGTTINIRFAGDESLNHRLAGAFSTMLG